MPAYDQAKAKKALKGVLAMKALNRAGFRIGTVWVFAALLVGCGTETSSTNSARLLDTDGGYIEPPPGYDGSGTDGGIVSPPTETVPTPPAGEPTPTSPTEPPTQEPPAEMPPVEEPPTEEPPVTSPPTEPLPTPAPGDGGTVPPPPTGGEPPQDGGTLPPPTGGELPQDGGTLPPPTDNPVPPTETPNPPAPPSDGGNVPGGVTCSTTATRTLFAGQHHDVGTVSVTNQGDVLIVKISLKPKVGLFEMHANVSGVRDNVLGPPGRFPYKNDQLTGVSTYEFRIDLSDHGLTLDDAIYLAVHAVVAPTGAGSVIRSRETAWADGDRLAKNWAMVFRFVPASCE